MEYQALYRKYRPKNLNEVYGQKVAVNILKNAIEKKKISHAYLFTGSRGSGKTSVAKIVARMVNCENLENGNPCEKCKNCLNSSEKNCVDIMEIDAASNNGVDEIRELKSKVNLVPSSLKYKVYIIDEVHMLSIGAFNALLKTLEEPPEHAIFILATTELDKVPNTIISRCQVIEFKKINKSDMFDRLKFIAENENININENAITEIVDISDGSLRDAVGMLDMATSFTNEAIDENTILEINGNISNSEIDFLCELIINKNLNTCLKYINEYYDSGKDLIKILEKVIINLKNKMLEQKNTNICSIIIKLSDTIDKMKKTSLGKIYLEISLFKICEINDNEIEQSSRIENINDTVQVTITKKEESVNNKEQNEIKNIFIEDDNNFDDNKFKNIRVNNTLVDANKNILIEIKKEWDKLNDYTFDRNYGALVCELLDASPVVANENYLVLTYNYDSFVSKGNSNHEKYEDVISKFLNLDKKIVFLPINEWNNIKKQYVINMKNNIKYEYIEENFENSKNKTVISNNEKNDIIEKANELFDSTKIEIKESV